MPQTELHEISLSECTVEQQRKLNTSVYQNIIRISTYNNTDIWILFSVDNEFWLHIMGKKGKVKRYYQYADESCNSIIFNR